MVRTLIAFAVVACLAVPAAARPADKKKQKKGGAPAPATVLVGTITRVDDAGKVLSITPFGGTKKAPADTTEITITPRTSVEYLGFEGSAEKKFASGQAVIVVLDSGDKALATAVKVARMAETPARKKKAPAAA